MAELITRVKELIPTAKPIEDEFPVTWNFSEFGASGTQSLKSGEWNRVGAYVVEAGMEYCIGRRFDGYIFISLRNTGGTQFHAKARFVVTNPAETRKEVVAEYHTREMGDIADKSKKPILPLSPPWVTQDSKIIMELDPESDQTIDYGNADTVMALDVTSRVAK